MFHRFIFFWGGRGGEGEGQGGLTRIFFRLSLVLDGVLQPEASVGASRALSTDVADF